MGRIYIDAMHRYAENAAKKTRRRDPYELLDAIGAVTKFSYEYERDGLKGFSTILNRKMFAVINGNLLEREQRIVAGHEAAHLILHKDEILSSPAQALKDFNLYDNSGTLEYQANQFLADFLASDENVLDIIKYEGMDYFGTARELEIPPPLLAFKLYSMMRRGYDVRNPADLESRFLSKSNILLTN